MGKNFIEIEDVGIIRVSSIDVVSEVYGGKFKLFLRSGNIATIKKDSREENEKEREWIISEIERMEE